jgi:hypothetical protein
MFLVLCSTLCATLDYKTTTIRELELVMDAYIKDTHTHTKITNTITRTNVCVFVCESL